jgi:hypothetical protein
MLITEALERSGLRKIVREDFTLSLRPGSVGLQVTDESSIPERFWLPQPSKLDRQALIGALKQGEVVAGASLTNASITIALRTR